MALPFQLKHQQNRSQTIISPVKVMLSKQSQKETAANPAWWFRKAEKRTLQNFQEMGLWECIVLMFLMETIESCACFHESIEGLLGSPCPHHSSQKNFHSMWFRTTSVQHGTPPKMNSELPWKVTRPPKGEGLLSSNHPFLWGKLLFLLFRGSTLEHDSPQSVPVEKATCSQSGAKMSLRSEYYC